MNRSFARKLFTPSQGIGGGGKDGMSVWGVVALAGAAAGAYHGFKRSHGNVGWSLAWGLGGGILPVPVVLPIAFMQGFAKPA